MIKLYIIIGLLAVCFIGFFYIISKIRKLNEKIYFLQEYRNTLIQLANDYFGQAFAAARSVNPQTLHWLVFNVNKAQRYVGYFGIGTYIGAFQKYKIDNCRFLGHIIPTFSTGRIWEDDMSILDAALTRALGHYAEVSEEYTKDARNPFKWLQYGIRFILSLPVQLLKWFGLISDNAAERITATTFFKVISGVVALISFISSVVGLIGGWQPFTETLHKWFPKLF